MENKKIDYKFNAIYCFVITLWYAGIICLLFQSMKLEQYILLIILIYSFTFKQECEKDKLVLDNEKRTKDTEKEIKELKNLIKNK